MSWLTGAACGGPDACLFFGPEGETERARRVREGKARAVCVACPVREQCLEYALEQRIRCGLWGGLNEKELFTERVRRARMPRAVWDHAGQVKYR
jgi:WhiB family redox-sensing transcriptional regulator